MDFFEALSILEPLLPIVGGVLDNVLTVLYYTWWFLVPAILLPIAFEYRLKYLNLEHLKSVKWAMLEMRIPKENLKSAKSMEQVFAALHAMHTFGVKGYDKYFKGKVEPRMSFEMVGHDGGVYFYIKTPVDFRNLVESAIFSQFPGAEISEVADYTDNFPGVIPNEAYDIWGTDIILAKDEPYPIKTYEYFEEKDKDRRIDPLAAVTEVMSMLKGSEMIGLQFLIRATSPAVNGYKEKGQQVVDKLLGKDAKKAAAVAGFFSGTGQFLKNLFYAPAMPPDWTKGEVKKDEKQPKSFAALSPSEKNIVEGIENKISKICFEVVIRFAIFGKKGELNRSFISPIMGSFRQYNIEGMNSFRPNMDTFTGQAGWIASFFPAYKNRMEYLKKRAMWDRYRLRLPLPKMSIMSIEEMATIFHIPSAYVITPKLRKLEAKKSEPPSDLPILE